MNNKIIFIILLFISHIIYANATLPILGKVEDFKLIDSHNSIFQYKNELAGKNWFAIFIFTRCPQICPTLVEQLKKISKVWPDAHYVAFSVDSEFDRPSVLEAFSKKHHLDNLKNWHFLTGEKKYIQNIIEQQFLIPTKQDIHTQKAILVDRTGLIRGYYSLADEQSFMLASLKILK